MPGVKPCAARQQWNTQMHCWVCWKRFLLIRNWQLATILVAQWWMKNLFIYYLFVYLFNLFGGVFNHVLSTTVAPQTPAIWQHLRISFPFFILILYFLFILGFSVVGAGVSPRLFVCVCVCEKYILDYFPQCISMGSNYMQIFTIHMPTRSLSPSNNGVLIVSSCYFTMTTRWKIWISCACTCFYTALFYNLSQPHKSFADLEWHAGQT